MFVYFLKKALKLVFKLTQFPFRGQVLNQQATFVLSTNPPSWPSQSNVIKFVMTRQAHKMI